MIDPRNSDEFYKIKQEIDKVSGCDYEIVEKNCETILQSQAKDLRVLGYLLFAKLQRQGIAGLCTALGLYSETIKNFAQQLFPEKPEVKVNSINWLNEPRIKQLVKSKLANADQNSINELIKQLKEVNLQLQQHLPEMPGILTGLLATLEVEQVADPDPNPPPLAGEGTGGGAPALVREAQGGGLGWGQTPQCTSDTEFNDLVQLQLEYLYKQNDWFRAVSLARAVRWSGLLVPTHQNNLTHVAQPHDSLRSVLAYQVEKGTPKEVLQCCENILMAPGGIFYFDAQYHAHRAVTDMGQKILADYILGELRILLERTPELINLLFADGAPFISSQYRSWLESLVASKNSNTSKNAVREQKDLNEIVNQLRAKIAGKTLLEKISVINSLPKLDRRIRFQHDYALARFCSEEKRLDLALPILEQLAQLITQHQLAEWEPEFAVAVWSELRNLWKAQKNFLSKDMQKQVEQRAEDLFSLICQTNLERAVNLK